MSRKNLGKDIHKQCPYRRKIGDYCKIHHKAKNVKRIDEPLDNEEKRAIIDEKPIILMQKMVRGWLVRKKIFRLYGPAIFNPCLSHDDVDPITYDTIWKIEGGVRVSVNEIPKHLFFSYVDGTGKIRCFNINSMKQLLLYKKEHPITGEKFSIELINNIKERIDYMVGKKMIKSVKYDELNIVFVINEIVISMLSLGFTAKNEWFINLNFNSLKVLLKECKNIFNASPNVNKKNIYPPCGNAFNIIVNKNTFYKELMEEILKFISKGVADKDKKYACYILLTALAYVVSDVKTEYPNIL